MAPTRLTARLLTHAEQAGVKVIAIGDPGQLGSIEAGGWLAALTRQHAGPALREVMRQRAPGEQQAPPLAPRSNTTTCSASMT